MKMATSVSAVTKRFAPDRKLINAKFEGYKLSPFPEQGSLFRTPLPCPGLAIEKAAQLNHLGFRDLQARVRFSHLAQGFPLNDNVGTAYYVDQEESKVVMVLFDKDTKQTSFQGIAKLEIESDSMPSYAEPDPTVPIDRHYPSIIAVTPTILVVSDGAGYIQVFQQNVETENKISASTLGTVVYEGDGTEGISPVPCTLLAGRLVNDAIILVLYSNVASTSTKFNICTMELTLQPPALKLLYMQRGSQVPEYVSLDDDFAIFGSETQYEVVKRADEDVKMMTEEEEKAVDKEARDIALHKVPPYSWTQDQTDITMQFVLPAGTPKAAISCAFTNQHLNLIIRAQDVDISYPYRKLWSTVKADECIWTLEPTTGLFTIFLVKRDEHTRWPHIFDTDDGVLETLDKNRLVEIAERLEKFTSTKEETGNGPTVQTHQHTVGADIDEDIDQDGQPIRFTVLNKRGEITEQISSAGSEWLCNAFGTNPSVCVKADVDGQVYTFERKGIIIEPKHVATFDAFAFVQASKRDSRYVKFDPSYQFAIIVESNRNAYIYYRHGDKRTIEKQTLVDLTQGRNIDILGVQLVLDRVVMILTEVEIITLIV